MTTTTDINGIPVEKLQGTIAKLAEAPDLAQFEFAAKNTWIEGTATRSTMDEWYGVGAQQPHVKTFTATADHPTLGHGHGPTPHEFVLHALASCIVAGIVTTAANRNIRLHSIETTASGAMDVRGILGIDPDVPKGFRSIDVAVDLRGEADDDALDALITASCKRSAVFELLTNPVPVHVARL